VAEEHKSFLEEIRRRRIVVSDMSPDVRIAATGGALMLALALMVEVARAHLGHDVAIATQTAPQITFAILPWGTVVAWLVGEWLISTLVFAGVMRLRLAVAGIVVIALGLALVAYLDEVPRGASLILLAPAVLLAGHLVARRGRMGIGGLLGFAALASTCVTVTIVVLYNAKRDSSIPHWFGVAGMIIATVGLFMAATDITELAQVGIEVLTGRFERWFENGALATVFAGVGMAVNLVVVWVVLRTSDRLDVIDHDHELIAGLAMLVFLILVVGMFDVGKTFDVPAHLSYGSILLYVVMFLAALVLSYTLSIVVPIVMGRHLTGQDVNLSNMSDRFGNGFMRVIAVVFIALFMRYGERSESRFRIFGFAACAAIFGTAFWNRDGDPDLIFGHGVVAGSVFLLVLTVLIPSMRAHWKQICRLVGVANFSLAAIQLLAYLFLAGPGKFEGQAVLSATIVAVALGWDIVTSGSITNAHTDGVPRFSRVAFFVSYIAMVGMLFMLSSTGRLFYFGAVAESGFASEGLVADGLMLIGAPMVLYLFALQLRAEFRSTE
jgi:hypothetical protein